MSALGALVGEVGLLAAVLGHLAYTVYENRMGTVAHNTARLKALGVITYRLAQESDDVSEQEVRQEVFDNGGDSDIFPSDFDVVSQDYPKPSKDDQDDRTPQRPGGGR